MDLNDTPEEAAFRAEARAWIEANAPAELREPLEKGRFGGSIFKDESEWLARSKDWQAKKFEAGYACLLWPKVYGGRGAKPVEAVIWHQEEGVYAALSQAFMIGQGMCGPTVMGYASEEQKKEFLVPMARGDKIWAQLFSEPGAGSDLAGLRTSAKPDGDEWVVNGQKVWSSGAHYADYAILLTRTDPDKPKHAGLTMFFLDMKTPGVEVRPIRQMSGRSGFNEVFFDDVRIPDAQRLGEVDAGWRVAITTLMNERMTIGFGIPTGIDDVLSCAARLETANGPAIDDPALRQKLAEWFAVSNGIAYGTYRILTALSRGQEPGPEASIAKLASCTIMQDMALGMLDAFGPEGLAAGGAAAEMQGLLFAGTAQRIAGGTDEVLRNVVAERVLGLPPDNRADRGMAFRDIPTGKG